MTSNTVTVKVPSVPSRSSWLITTPTLVSRDAGTPAGACGSQGLTSDRTAAWVSRVVRTRT
jgi:hypothetical protein